MRFTCSKPEEQLCPEYYILVFHGPTKEAVPPNRFSPLVWTQNVPYELAELSVTHTLNTPGEYWVYAYPELYYCSQWNNLKYPWMKAAVEGTPFKLIVKG